jgi:predicted  nucleic acid-binding Zn-ribbon protein
LKDYEELLIQMKKEKDELTRLLNTKESECNLLQSQFNNLETEISALKSAISSEFPIKSNISNIEIASLKSEVSIYSESLKKLKENLSKAEEDYVSATASNRILESKLKRVLEEHKTSIDKIHDLENIIKQSSDINIKYNKALDEIQDLSTIIESFKKDSVDPKSFDDKSSGLEDQTTTLKKDLQSAYRKINKLTQLLSEKDKDHEDLLNKSKSIEHEGSKKINSLQEDFDKIKAELIHNNARQAREIEILQSRIKTQEEFFEKELQKTHLELDALTDENNKNKTEIGYLTSEHDRLINLELVLNNRIPDNYEDLKEILDQQLAKRESSVTEYRDYIEKLVREKENLRDRLKSTETELQNVSEECQKLYKTKFESVRNVSSLSSVESSSYSVHDSFIIEEISPSIILHNPLQERLSKLRKEPPMPYSTMWKTLETLMQEKLKSDKIDLDIGRIPRNVSDYMFEFMYKQFGLKALGLKQLKAMTVSLEELYKISHPYAVFFSRVLGILHPRPIPTKLSTYLFEIQERFNSLSKKIKKPESFPELYETMQFGGEASIIDVIELVKKVFKDDRLAGERILDTLHRDQPDKLELAILKVCGGLQRLGKTSKDLFSLLKPFSEALEYSEFINGIREKLNIWITQEEGELISHLLDKGETGVILLKSWESSIDFNDFCNKIYTKPAMVSKADFLNALISEYELQAIEDYYKLKQVINVNSLTPAIASNYLIQIDSGLTMQAQERLFKEAVTRDGKHGKEVSSESLCLMILKHNIGGYGRGVFQLEILLKSLD